MSRSRFYVQSRAVVLVYNSAWIVIGWWLFERSLIYKPNYAQAIHFVNALWYCNRAWLVQAKPTHWTYWLRRHPFWHRFRPLVSGTLQANCWVLSSYYLSLVTRSEKEFAHFGKDGGDSGDSPQGTTTRKTKTSDGDTTKWMGRKTSEFARDPRDRDQWRKSVGAAAWAADHHPQWK